MPISYRLQNDARRGEIGGLPFILGDALRVPSTAYKAWGITGHPAVLHAASLGAYHEEFFDTSDEWMNSVIASVTSAGLGNRSQMLRDGVGKIAAEATLKLLDKQDCVHVLDVGCGAGASLQAYLKALNSLDPEVVSSRVVVTCVDHSRNNLGLCADKMMEYGFSPGETLYTVNARDIDMPAHVDPESQDMVINVAGIHANAYLQSSMNAISKSLRKGGLFISGNWHHGLWLHPSHMFSVLQSIDADRFEWKNKDRVLEEYAAKFRRALEKPDLSWAKPEDLVAMKEIAPGYWVDGWATERYERIKAGKLKPMDEQIVLEGHRPVEHYIEYGRRNGLELDDSGLVKPNPQRVAEGTNLNMLLVLKKAA